MAKGLRASTRKRNNAKLRATVFGPASDARTERLSQKLQELAAKPRPDQERVMEVDKSEDTQPAEDSDSADTSTDEMLVDKERKGQGSSSTSKRKGHPSRIEKKKAKRKARSSIVFPTRAQHKKRNGSGKKRS